MCALCREHAMVDVLNVLVSMVVLGAATPLFSILVRYYASISFLSRNTIIRFNNLIVHLLYGELAVAVRLTTRKFLN